MKTLETVRQSLAPAEPWHTPLYLAQCFTFRIATSLAGDFRDVSTWEERLAPPFCLRLRRAYRGPTAQAFRDTVAREARRARKGYRWEVTAWNEQGERVTLSGREDTPTDAANAGIRAEASLASKYGEHRTLAPTIEHP